MSCSDELLHDGPSAKVSHAEATMTNMASSGRKDDIQLLSSGTNGSENNDKAAISKAFRGYMMDKDEVEIGTVSSDEAKVKIFTNSACTMDSMSEPQPCK